MTSFKGTCSYCYEDFLKCRCEQFHPKRDFVLSESEIGHLLDYFNKRAGYISREFDAPIFDIIKRLEKGR